MGFWLNGFQGDNAGAIVGRVPNQLVVAFTTSGDAYLSNFELEHYEWQGQQVYADIEVQCLTPGTNPALAVNVQQKESVLLIGLAQWDAGQTPWAPAVHLFSVGLNGNGSTIDSYGSSFVIVTAVIDNNLPTITFDDLNASDAFMILKQARVRRRRSPVL
jgi:hypothetical protein